MMVNDNSELCGLAGQAVTEKKQDTGRKKERFFWLMIPDTVKVPLSAFLLFALPMMLIPFFIYILLWDHQSKIN